MVSTWLWRRKVAAAYSLTTIAWSPANSITGSGRSLKNSSIASRTPRAVVKSWETMMPPRSIRGWKNSKTPHVLEVKVNIRVDEGEHLFLDGLTCSREQPFMEMDAFAISEVLPDIFQRVRASPLVEAARPYRRIGGGELRQSFESIE